MDSVVRPEVLAFVRRFAQALLGAALTALAVYWTLSIPGVLRWFTAILAVVSLAATVDGLRRGRLLRFGADIAGVLEIEERQITWLTSEGGGTVSIDDLTKVELLARNQVTYWRLLDSWGTALLVPYSANGAGGLIDGLAPLKGLDLTSVARALETPGDHTTVIWRA